MARAIARATVQTTKPKEEQFHLTQVETGVTGTDITTSQTGLWLQGWRYQVPVGTVLVLLPTSTFSIYAKDIATAELTVADKFRILVMDPSRKDSKLVMGDARYTQVNEFQDRKKIKRLDIQRPVVVKENEWIVIEGYMAVSLDVSACWFDLSCQRVRQAIYK